MKQDEQMKFLKDRLDKIIIDLKSERDNNIQKLSGFEELAERTVEKIKVINPKNYTLSFQYSNTKLIISWLKLLIRKTYETQIVVSEIFKDTFTMIYKISNDEERKGKLEELENKIKEMQEDREKYGEYFDLLDKSIEMIKEKEKELIGRGVYG